jgi:tetratricopeptide (TPR) repeat protein
MRLANVSDDRSDPHAIHMYARQSYDLAAQTGDQAQLALSLQMLSLAELRLGATERGLELGQRALLIARASDTRPAIAKCLGQLGLNYEHIGDVAAALRHTQEAIAIYRELGDLSETATQLNNLGYIANSFGDFPTGRRALEEGLQIAAEIGSRLNEIYLLSNLGSTLIGLDDYLGAEAVARRGIHMCEISRVSPFPDFYRDLAEVCLRQGRVGEAVEAAHQGLDLARRQDDPREIGSAWRVLARAIGRMPEPQGARPCFAESARLLSEAGATIERARTLRAWAEYELRSGDAARGRELTEEARAIFTRAGLIHELERLPFLP